MEQSTTDKGDFTPEDDSMPEPVQYIQLRHPSRVLPRVPRSVLARLVMVRPDPSVSSPRRVTTAAFVKKAGDSVKTPASSPQKKGKRVKAVSSPHQRPIKEEKVSSKPRKKSGSAATQREKADQSAAKESVRPTQRRNLADESVPSEEGSWTVRLVRLETNTLKKHKRKLEESSDKLQPRKARAVKKEVWYSEKDEDDIWNSDEDEDDVWNSDDDWGSDEDEEFQYRPKKPKKMQNNTARNYSTESKFKKLVGKSKSSTELPRTQSGVKKYPCPDCGIVFFQKSNLIEHQVFHKEPDLPGIKEKSLHNSSNVSVNRKVNKSKYGDEKGHLNEMKSASKHPQTTQGKKPHPCDECERSFNAYEMLLQHKRVHASEKAFMCVEEKKGVKKHHQKTPEKKPHPCDECEKSFNAYEMLLQHKRVHASEKSSKCVDEKKNVSKPKSESKTKVEKKASEKKPYPCSDCDLSFNSASLLLQHQKAHTRDKRSTQIDEEKGGSKLKGETKASEKKPYPCSDCDLSFNSSLVLLQHQKVHTREKVSTRIDEKKSVGKPKVETKASEKKPYPCSECEMSFNTSSMLLLHQKVHANGKDSMCHDDKNTAHKLGNLVTDKMSTCCESEKCSHDSSPPQQPKIDGSLNASVCLDENSLSTLENNAPEKTSVESEKSSNPSSLPLQQQKIPTSAKSCTCNVCGKMFSKSSLLIIHRRVHTGYFACNECGKSFSALSSLKVHQIKHKGSKSYSCNECGKTFKIPSYLELHQRIHTLEKWRDKRGSGSKKRSLKKSKFGKKALKGF